MSGGTFKEVFVDADGFHIRYVEAGSGEPVICLHGGGGLHLSPAYERLAQDFRVIAFEMPGFGSSPENLRSSSTADLARTMTHAVEALGIEKHGLIGHSFGSKVTLQMAIQKPDAVDAIVLIAPGAVRDVTGPIPTRVAREEAIRLLYAHPERQTEPLFPEPEIVAKHVALIGRMKEPGRDQPFEEKLAALSMPVLALFGTRDEVTPPEGAHLYRNVLKNCYITLVYDAAHAVDCDRPEAVASVIGNFLARKDQFFVRNTSSLLYP